MDLTQYPEFAPCATGFRCNDILKQPAHRRHRCPNCDKHIHAFCGVEIPNPSSDYHNRRCFDCEEARGNNNNSNHNNMDDTSDESSIDQRPLNALGPDNQPRIRPHLEDIRASMTLDNAKKKTRSQNTYYKHNLENQRFIMYLFRHPDYCTTCLDPELVEDLEDKEAGVVIPENLKKRWRTLPPEIRKTRQDNYVTDQLRGLISECLGEAGIIPPPA